MLDTKKSMSLVDELLKSDKPADQAPKSTPVAPVEPKETKSDDAKEPTVDSKAATQEDSKTGAAEEPQVTQPVTEKKPTEEKMPKFSNQKQIDYAFAKEKAKRKQLQAKYDAVTKELATLKAKSQSIDKSSDDYIDYKIDVKSAERERASLQDEIRESEIQEYSELNNARIAHCFPDETERAKFNSIRETEGPKLLNKLDAADPDQAVLQYLDDSDIAPLLTRLFIADSKYLDAVLAKRSPMGKYIAMKDLEDRVQYAREKMAAEGKPEQSREVPQAKPVLPVIGSVTKSDADRTSPAVFDPNEYIRAHKSRRYH